MDRSALVLHARFQRASEQPRPSSLSEFRLETILWNRKLWLGVEAKRLYFDSNDEWRSERISGEE